MDNGTNGLPGAERRSCTRQALELNKILAAEVCTEGFHQRCYLYVMDISEDGMRITSHFTFPENTPVNVTFLLEEPLDVTVERVWQKSISGTEMMGMKFVKVTDEAQERVRQFMQRFSADKRKNFRLDRVLSVQMNLGSYRKQILAMTLDLSAGGMRISTEDPLPENRIFPACIQLEHKLPPVLVTGRVVWQKATTFQTYLIGIEFKDPSPEAIQRIESYIDKAIAGLVDSPFSGPSERNDRTSRSSR